MRPILPFRPILLAASSLLAGLASATTEQLGVLPESAKSMGMVGGRFANLDDPSALRQNPANILMIGDREALVNAGFWYADVDYTGIDGATTFVDDPWKYLGSLYYVHPVEPGKLALGLGVSTPFGLNFKYPRNSAFKYVLPHEALLLTVDVNPVLAYRLNDWIRIGAGLDLMYSKLRIEQDFPWAAVPGLPPGTPDGHFEFESSGSGIGGFLGVSIDLSEHQRLAVVGRLPIKVEYDGDLHASNFPAPLSAVGFTPESSFSSEITFPAALSVGYGIDLGKKKEFTLGVDFEWAQNSTHEDIPLLIGNNQTLLGLNPDGTPVDRLVLDWEDSYSIGFGAEWRATERWSLRTGYLYTKTSMPDFTFTPAVASNDRHIFSTGVGYHSDRLDVDLSWAYVSMEDRNVSANQQPRFTGRYTFDWNIITLSATCRF